MISQSRWEDLINITIGTLLIHNHSLDILVTKEELDTIASVLKNNTPFQVVSDQLFYDDVILETKNFSVLGDKE